MNNHKKSFYNESAKKYVLDIKWIDSVFLLDENFALHSVLNRISSYLTKSIKYLKLSKKYQKQKTLAKIYSEYKTIKNMCEFLYPAIMKNNHEGYNISYELVRDNIEYKWILEDLTEFESLMPKKYL